MATSASDRLASGTGPVRALKALLLLLLGIAMLAMPGSGVEAHPMPDSRVGVRLSEGRWRVHMVLPGDRLAMALINTGDVPDPGPDFAAYPELPEAAVSAYLRRELRVTGSDGRRWQTVVRSMERADTEHKDWVIDADLLAPEGTDSQRGTLHYGVIVAQVIPDVAIVTLEQDWQGGMVNTGPVLLGTLDADHQDLAIAGGEGGGLASIAAMFRLGIDHILEGLDHLAFLATLMLTVALRAEDGSWRPLADKRKALRNALWRVSAFTIGHSLSLVAVSFEWISPPATAVEAFIALSVAVSAVHALKPVYPGRETVIACLFGLVHGMAFATVLRDMALPTQTLIGAALAFNLGIEAVQVGLVAVTLPALVALRDSTAEPLLRRGIALVALVAALYWLADRLGGFG